ncbi:unannotated protein [freshwater metagenome]|uniref:Unannotated protein n=1 Tax=freshwater metagenome TaxID=449393 RepID=A0A6J6X396_9ZZZZ
MSRSSVNPPSERSPGNPIIAATLLSAISPKSAPIAGHALSSSNNSCEIPEKSRTNAAFLPSSVCSPANGTRPTIAAEISKKSPYRSVRAPNTEFAKTIAFDSAQAICVPNAGRCPV